MTTSSGDSQERSAIPSNSQSSVSLPPVGPPEPPAHPGNTGTIPPAPAINAADLAGEPVPSGVPTRIGRFHVLRFLGKGAFGHVYLASHPSLKRLVALKVAKPDQLNQSVSPERLARFEREAQAIARLVHANVVPVYDFGRDGPHFYIASGYVEGESLEKRLKALPKGETLPVPQAVRAVVFSHDGRMLVSGGEDHTLRLWDVQTGAELMPPLLGHTSGVWAVAFTPDGRRVVSGSADTRVRIWEVQPRRVLFASVRIPSRQLQLAKEVRGVAVTDDGKRILAGDANHTVTVWDADSLRVVQTFRSHNNRVHAIACSPDGLRVVSGSADSTLKLWDLKDGKELSTWKGHAAEVLCVDWSRDGKQLASAGEDHVVRLWNVDAKQDVLSSAGYRQAIRRIAFRPVYRIRLGKRGRHAQGVGRAHRQGSADAARARGEGDGNRLQQRWETSCIGRRAWGGDLLGRSGRVGAAEGAEPRGPTVGRGLHGGRARRVHRGESEPCQEVGRGLREGHAYLSRRGAARAPRRHFCSRADQGREAIGHRQRGRGRAALGR